MEKDKRLAGRWGQVLTTTLAVTLGKTDSIADPFGLLIAHT